MKKIAGLLCAALLASLFLSGCQKPGSDISTDNAESVSPEWSTGSESSTESENSTESEMSVGISTADDTDPTDSTVQSTGKTTESSAAAKPAGERTSAATTSASTTKRTTQTTVRPLPVLPLKTEWILRPTLEYNEMIPTTDGKNWIGEGEKEFCLLDTSGRILVRADFMESGEGNYQDRIVARKDGKYALLTSSGKTVLDYQGCWLLPYGDELLKNLNGTDQFVRLDRSGKEIGKYDGDVGMGSIPSKGYFFEQKSGKLYKGEYFDYRNYDGYIHILDYEPVNSHFPPSVCAFVGESIEESEMEAPHFTKEYGWGVVVDGKLKSTTLYHSLVLLKDSADWRRDLYLAARTTSEKNVYRYLLTNAEGTPVLKDDFQAIRTNSSCTAAAVQENGKWGFIKIPTL